VAPQQLVRVFLVQPLLAEHVSDEAKSTKAIGL
jgi:hypothetical protein